MDELPVWKRLMSINMFGTTTARTATACLPSLLTAHDWRACRSGRCSVQRRGCSRRRGWAHWSRSRFSTPPLTPCASRLRRIRRRCEGPETTTTTSSTSTAFGHLCLEYYFFTDERVERQSSRGSRCGGYR